MPLLALFSRRRGRLRPVASLAVVGVSAVLAACGGGDGSSTADSQGGSGKAGDGKMVRHTAFRAKVRHLDPMLIGDVTSSEVASTIFETLYKYHYLKRKELVPQLAAKMPELSEDRKVWTIKIRKGVTFHDDPCFENGEGRELVAKDFIYAWKRIANVYNASPSWSFLDGRIVGLNDFRKYTQKAKKGKVDYSRPVEGLTAVDRHTLRIELTEPSPQFRYILAHLPTAPIPREAVEHYGEEFINHPVGTGPYMLKKWQRGNEIVLERNPDFRKVTYPSEGSRKAKKMGLLADAGKRVPFIDRIEIAVIQESQPYWLQFKQGKIDSAGIPKDSFDQAIAGGAEDPSLTKPMKKRGIKLHTIKEPGTFWIGFNMDDPVVGESLALRKALSRAIDRKEYIRKFTNGRGIPARGFFPPVFDVYNPDLKNPAAHYDPGRAKELVAKAKKQLGGSIPTLRFFVPGTDSRSRQVGQYMTAAWKKVGLKVEAQPLPWPTFQQRVDNQSAQMFQMGWLADFPDPENFLFLYYGPNSPKPNSTNYDDPKINKLYEKMKTMPRGPERKKLCRKMEQMIVKDVPNIFLFHGVSFALRHPWLKNYRLHPWASGTMRYQRVDMGMRRERVGG